VNCLVPLKATYSVAIEDGLVTFNLDSRLGPTMGWGNLRRGWYRCLEKAEIRTIRFHDLRHTLVSLLIRQGAHPKYIQEQAGHSGIQVTMDTYGHLFPSQNREWVNKLDDVAVVPRSYPQPLEAERDERATN